MTVVIYHNPACGTSRKVLAALKAAGLEPTVIDYQKTPLDRATLTLLLRRMGKSARDILRKKGTPYAELHLDDPSLSEEALLDAIERHPILIERPIVAIGDKVVLCRPAESVEALLRQANTPE